MSPLLAQIATGAAILIGLGVLAVLVFMYFIGIYNQLVALKNRFKNAFAQIDVQLKRDYDLIPNLVETAKGYMKHERETLEAVIQARDAAATAGQQAAANPGNPQAMQALSGAETALTGVMTRFMALMENYPDLKANQNMLALQEELTSTENKIAFARQAYNDSVMNYNTARETFPNNLVVGFGDFPQADLFQVGSAAERETVKVQFQERAAQPAEKRPQALLPRRGALLRQRFAMDFFAHQDRARRKTGWLVLYMLVAVVLIIVSVYVAVASVLFWAQARGDSGSQENLWFPELFAAVSLGTMALIGGGSFFKIAQLAGGGEVVAHTLGGRRVNSDTRDLRERVLLNVVEEMAIASGTPVPPVYLMDHEGAINAFAAGTTPQNAVIGVTRGTIETLSRDELQGVIAHEFSHILNGDMRLNIRLIGILSGILLISTIGYILMRTSSRHVYFSNSGNKKGSNPLPLLGFLLYVIGYVGIFFGNLIKSAVSRQREYLADASAVQFTRLPDGIAGALKKIGGLASGSRLTTPQAAEASHMYFGNGLAEAWLQLLATHPPLLERICRIEPSFDGKFMRAQRVEYTTADLVDPHTLEQRRASFASAHAEAVAGAAAMAAEPRTAVEQIGEPRIEHIDYAHALVASLPPQLEQDIRDPLGAVATIYALLLEDDEPDVRSRQIAYLAQQANPRAYQETLRIAPSAEQLQPEAKLPLVGMVVPALKGLSRQQLLAFAEDVRFLISADNKVSLFEFGVHRLVLKRLLPRLAQKRSPRMTYHRVGQLTQEFSTVLSTLAYFGSGDPSQAQHAFDAGAAVLTAGGARVNLLPLPQSGLSEFDAAIDQLAAASPQIKKLVLEACAACISHDGQVTVKEGELLRMIADALESPMPPLLAQHGVHAPTVR